MTPWEIALALVAGGLWMRACGKIARHFGLRGRAAVGAAFALAQLLTALASLAIYSADDQLVEVDLLPSLGWRAVILVPWAAVDLLTQKSPDDAYAWPGKWGTRALAVVLALPFALGGIARIGMIVMRPTSSREATRIVRAAADRADACESPSLCLDLADTVVDRIEHGRITFRSLALILWADGAGHDRGEAMSDADALLVFHVIHCIDANDGHPPSPHEMDEIGETMMDAMRH